jgi:hypothetical protein
MHSAQVKKAGEPKTVFVLKAPAEQWAAIRGTVPVRLTHALYNKPTAPVIRTQLQWYDYQSSHLSFETFTNIDDEEQRILFRRLSRQPDVVTLCYSESLDSPIQKRITNAQMKEVEKIAQMALVLRQLIPDHEYDFDQAKARVIASTRMD